MRLRRLIRPRFVVGLSLIVGTVVVPWVKTSQAVALSGSSFNNAHIVDDSVFFNAGTMSTNDIQNFLNAKVPSCDTNGTQPSGRSGYATRADLGRASGVPPPYICLKDYSQAFSNIPADAYCGGITGGTKSAANIIFDVSQACGINPETLIVLLQKEQSIVTDDWPWPVQYRSATGYGCPDTAACDTQYYGFFNQVYNAARQFKRYVQQPGSFNYAVGRNSYVLYNPNTSCGGTTFTIENKATAALYNYTPYQPNGAALANLYGSGDGCSAYGNRNFWRFFNDWFGPTTGNGYVLAISDDPNDLRQWVIYGTIKQYVPSGEIKRAWNLPDQPTVFSASYLASTPTGPTLDRIFRINGGADFYLADGGKRYRLPSLNYLSIYNMTGRVISSVSGDLGTTPADGGMLTPYVLRASGSTVYMLDGPVGGGSSFRPYANATVLAAIEGSNTQPITISDELYASLGGTVGAVISTTRFIGPDSTQYIAADGTKRPLSGAAQSLFPAGNTPVSAATITRLDTGPAMQYMLRDVSTAIFYILDNGQKRALSNDTVYGAWSTPGSYFITVSPSFLSLIPSGPTISNYTADAGGTMYIVDGYKSVVPSALDHAYRTALPPTSVSTSLLSLIQDSGTTLTHFFQETGTPNVYLLDNSGVKHLINSADVLTLWGGYTYGVPLISGKITGNLSQAPGVLSIYVNDGTNEYVLSGGKRKTISSAIKSEWALGTSQTINDGTLNDFALNGALDNRFNLGSSYYIVKQGTCYGTIDSAIGAAWNITSAPSNDFRLVRVLIGQYSSLTRFVRSSGSSDYTMYLVDKNVWYRLKWPFYINLGGPNVPMMILPPDGSTTIQDWLSPVIKNDAGQYFVVDSGGKRNMPAQMIIDQWTNWGSLPVNTLSNEFVASLPYRGIVERTIKGSAPAVFTVVNGQKRHILYPDTYTRYYAPYGMVGDPLIYALADGPDL